MEKVDAGMFKKILVPLDGSEVSASVIPYVANLAHRLGATVTLFEVSTSGLDTLNRDLAQSMYSQQIAVLEAAGVDTSTSVVFVEPAQQIAEFSKSGQFDLIAMGTHGRTGIRRGVLGSVTDEVVRSVSLPVLVLSPGAVEATQQAKSGAMNITVPLDGSEVAENVLPYAVGLAAALSLDIRLLRVVSMSSVAFAGGDGVMIDTAHMEQDLEEEASSYLKQEAEKMATKGMTVTCAVEKGSSSLAIINHLKNIPENILAICTHGRSGLGRLLIGSVADSIIRSAEVPVLVITPKGAESS